MIAVGCAPQTSAAAWYPAVTYRFFAFPVVSAGASWFDQPGSAVRMELLGVTTFDSGVVGLYYRPISTT